MHVSDNIYLIVFGESTLNDAVAIALGESADSIREMIGHGLDPNYFVVTVNSIMFFTVFFTVSILIGFLISILCSLLFVKLDLDLFPWLEIGLFLQCAYLPYIIAEA